MKTLTEVIETVYEDCLYGGVDSTSTPIGKSMFMTVPLTDTHFELPLFASCALQDERVGSDVIAVTLNTFGRKAEYKSLANNMRYALYKSYAPYHLIRITPDSEPEAYYATWGAIFNKDFIPVMMMTWEVERIDTDGHLKVLSPVIRISPDVVRKTNAVERFILNRILPEALSANICYPPAYNSRVFTRHSYSDIVPSIKAIIGDFPFALRGVDTPSASTTNKDLLDIALNHLDEIV